MFNDTSSNSPLEYRQPLLKRRNAAAIGSLVFLLLTLGGLLIYFKVFRGDFRGKAAVPPTTLTMYTQYPPASGTVTSSPNMGFETKKTTGTSTFVASKKTATSVSIGGGSSSTISGSYLGLRFAGLAGMDAYNISKAYLEVVPQASSSNTFSIEIAAEVGTGVNHDPAPFDANVMRLPSSSSRQLASSKVTPQITPWTAGTAVRFDVSAAVQSSIAQTRDPNQSMIALIIKGTGVAANTRKIYGDWNNINSPKLILELTPKASPTQSIVYTMGLASKPPVYLSSDIVYEYAFDGSVVFPRTNAGAATTTSKIGSWNKLTGTGPFRSLFTGFRFGQVDLLSGETSAPALSTLFDSTKYDLLSASLKLTPNVSQTGNISIELFGEGSNSPQGYTSQTNYDDVGTNTIQTSLDGGAFLTSGATLSTPAPTIDGTENYESLNSLTSDPTSGFSFRNTNKPSQRTLTSQKSIYPTAGVAPSWTAGVATLIDVTAPVTELATNQPDEVGIIAIGVENAQKARTFYNDAYSTVAKRPKLELKLKQKSNNAEVIRTVSLASPTRIESDGMNESGTALTPKATNQVNNWVGTSTYKNPSTGLFEGYLGMRFCCVAQVPSGFRFSKAELVLVPNKASSVPINFEIRAEKNSTPDVFSVLGKPSLRTNLTSPLTISNYTSAWSQYAPVSFDISNQYNQVLTASPSQSNMSLILKGTSTTTTKNRTFYSLATFSRYQPQIRVTLVPVNPPATVTLTATPQTVSSEDTVELTWTTTNATGCTASSSPAGIWSGSQATSNTTGVTVGPLSQTTTFTLNCTAPGGSGSDSVQVTVVPAPTIPTFTADNATVVSGQGTTLRWTVQNATSCTPLAGTTSWRATAITVPTGTAPSGAITGPTTFTLHCVNSLGTVVEKSVTVSASTTPSVPPSIPPSVPPSPGTSELFGVSSFSRASTANGQSWNMTINIPAGNNRIVMATVNYVKGTFAGSSGKQINSMSCYNAASNITLFFRLMRMESSGVYQNETWVSLLAQEGLSTNIPANAAFSCDASISVSSQRGIYNAMATFFTIPDVKQNDLAGEGPFHTGLDYTGPSPLYANLTGDGAFRTTMPSSQASIDNIFTLPSAQVEPGDLLLTILYATDDGFDTPVNNVLTPMAGVKQETYYKYVPDPNRTKVLIGTRRYTSGAKTIGVHQSIEQVWAGSAISVNKL